MVIVARAVVVKPESDLVGLRGRQIPLEAVGTRGEVGENQVRRTAIRNRVNRRTIVRGRRAGVEIRKVKPGCLPRR